MPFVDSREHDTMKKLAKERGFSEKMLETGDYQSDEDTNGKYIKFERKSDDFLSSIFSENLYLQLRNMVNDPKTKNAYLIVDKSLFEIQKEAIQRGVHPETVLGMISSLTLRGFPPIFSDNQTNCMTIIEKTFLKHVDGKSRDVCEKTIIGGENLIVFPGIDQKIGKNLLMKFSSFKSVANATVEELMEVDGIGPVLAQRIYNLCNNRKV